MNTKVSLKATYEARAWKWMRYSALLLIPLAWGHMVWQDLIVGVHKIDLNYVALRWASMTWRAYDFFLLAFAFAHGVNGLRQVMMDFVRTDKWRSFWSWALFILWLVITLFGAGAIIGGVRLPKP